MADSTEGPPEHLRSQRTSVRNVLYALKSFDTIYQIEARYRPKVEYIFLTLDEAISMEDEYEGDQDNYDPMEQIRRRAEADPAFKYNKFDTFPWTSDGKFQKGFLERVNKVVDDTPGMINTFVWLQHLLDLTLPLRVERFKEVTDGIEVDIAAYKAYRAVNPGPGVKILPNPMESHMSPQTMNDHGVNVKDWARALHELFEARFPQFERYYAVQDAAQAPLTEADLPADPALANAPARNHPDTPGTTNRTASSAGLPSWQSAAPKRDLYVDKAAAALAAASTSDSGSGSGGGSGSGKEPYPKQFDDIIEHLTSGKEIAGIRKIPDTVVNDPNISVTGRPAPAKPWEKRRAEEKRVEEKSVEKDS